MIGMINMLKPVGLTSSDVVVRVRGILRRHTGEKYKVGHMGTLDPGASGVLPVAIGNATRLFGLLANKTKIYRAIMRFGYSTDTCDSYGIVTEKSEHIPTISELASILPSFVGKINQIPPKYSAISINGKRAYSMARENIDFDIPVRTITINSLEIIEQLDDRTFVIDINCMGGTYIRTLIYDIAKKLE